jgi:hypothetical protein
MLQRLSKLIRSDKTKRSRKLVSQQRRKVLFESLERRQLLATLTWTGGANDGNLATAANWSTGSVPASGDTLVFDGAAPGTLAT